MRTVLEALDRLVCALGPLSLRPCFLCVYAHEPLSFCVLTSTHTHAHCGGEERGGGKQQVSLSAVTAAATHERARAGEKENEGGDRGGDEKWVRTQACRLRKGRGVRGKTADEARELACVRGLWFSRYGGDKARWSTRSDKASAWVCVRGCATDSGQLWRVLLTKRHNGTKAGKRRVEWVSQGRG